jgi:hypothetical protein
MPLPSLNSDPPPLRTPTGHSCYRLVRLNEYVGGRLAWALSLLQLLQLALSFTQLLQLALSLLQLLQLALRSCWAWASRFSLHFG